MAYEYFTRFQFPSGLPLSGDRRVTGSPEHIALARKAAAAGMVLLKNEASLLPFGKGTKLALFGVGSEDYVKGGGGSSDVTCAYVKSVREGLEEKEAEGYCRLYAPLVSLYRETVRAAYAEGVLPGEVREQVLPEETVAAAAAFTDTAVFVISRRSRESADRTAEPYDGDFYLSREEEQLKEQLCRHFPKVAVLLNAGSIVDLSWVKRDARIGAALFLWMAGMEGGSAAADLLFGQRCPEGKLPDTFAESFDAYPYAEGFYASDKYVDYTEDIYVGYRYFETLPGAAEKVVYPFGFGLSYTAFEPGEAKLQREGDRFTLTQPVKNCGGRAGRETLFVFVSQPQGRLGKPAKSLVGFAKTALLQPGETETLSVSFTAYELASYDDLGKVAASAYVLEAGEYRILTGTDVRCAREVYAWQEPEDRVLKQLTPQAVPHALKARLRPDGSLEPLPTDAVIPERDYDEAAFKRDHHSASPLENNFGRTAKTGELLPKVPAFDEVIRGNMSLEEFIAGISDEELCWMTGGQPARGIANTCGMGNNDYWKIPNIMTCDGPCGVRIRPECRVTTTAFPSTTLLAASFDRELLEEVGKAIAAEALENNMGMLLAPGINIHRNPLCGRNFEYYSEDPLVAGLLSAAFVRGAQQMQAAGCVKHFACNNKETLRRGSDSRLSERALREIYLKGFELCIREADPWTLMVSYNIINGTQATENADTLTHILREEWGYTGLVMTDWRTNGDYPAEIAAGIDVKMPYGDPAEMITALAEGRISRKELERAVGHLLQLFLKLARDPGRRV